MNAVIYYSNTGESRKIAEYAAEMLTFPLFDVWSLPCLEFGDLVLVFPVHCQSIPRDLKPIVHKITAKNVVLLVTYGKMSCGNVLYACQKIFGDRIITAAYLPTKHSYLADDTPFADWSALDFLTEIFQNPKPARIPRHFKNPFSALFPRLRSRLGVRLVKGDACDHCGLCTAVCKHASCIRCLKCVQICPKNARTAHLRLPMRLYLKKRKKHAVVIYRTI